MKLIDKLLSQMEEDDQEEYVVILEDVLKIPKGGNYNPNLSCRTRLFFASDEDKIKALELMNKYKQNVP